MASTYSPNLRLELIGTGEQQGTWGATTNTNLGTLLEEAIGGYTSVTVADAGDTTLTTANGAADQSRNMTINLTGTLTASRNVIVPAIEKVYLVKNATSGGFAVTVKVSGQTGVSVANGTTMLVFVDGTDVRQAGAQVGASNSLVLAAGSASAPSLTTTGDTNTGLCFPAADTISASTGGAERMRIDSSGNVGIGISPSTRLHVYGADTELRVQSSTATSGYVRFLNTSGSMSIGMSGGATNTLLTYDRTNSQTAHEYLGGASGYHAWYTAGSERMRIDASGNVGIGTSAINYRLDVYRGSTNGSVAQFTGNNLGRGLLISTSQTSFADDTAILNAQMAGSGQMVLQTGGAERMRIDASGNVGIGVTPSAWSGLTALQIKGASIASSTRELSTQGNAYYNSGWKYIDTAAASQYLQSAGVHYWYTAASGTAGSAITFTERMRIDSSGNVGIGVSPGSTARRLTVYGSTGTAASTSLALQTSTTGTTSSDGFTMEVDGTIGYLWNYENDSIRIGTNATERMRIDASGNVLVTSSGGLGYGTGSGGTVTQATSKGTAVTLNKTNGKITMSNSSLSPGPAGFTVTNSTVAATDTIIINISGGAADPSLYNVWAVPAAGSFAVYLRNISSGALAEAVQLNFSVIKATTS